MSAARRTRRGGQFALSVDAQRATECCHAVCVHLPSFSASVISNSPRVVRMVRSLYPTSRAGATGPGGTTTAAFAVVERAQGPAGPSYSLSADGVDVGRFATASDVVAHLEYLLNAAAATGLGRYLLLHAGAVVAGHGAIVIPGSSGVGKSTLVTALSLAGYGYLTDELVLVDSKVVARPFLKPICLKEGGWRLLSTAYALPPSLSAVRADGQRVRYLRPPHPCANESAVPIRYIMLPRRRAGTGATLTPCSRAQTLAELARHSLNLPRHAAGGLELLARMVERAECYSLTYDAVSQAVAVISDRVGDGHLRSRIGE